MIATSHIKNRAVVQRRRTPGEKTSGPSGMRGFDSSSLRETIPFWFGVSRPFKRHQSLALFVFLLLIAAWLFVAWFIPWFMRDLLTAF